MRNGNARPTERRSSLARNPDRLTTPGIKRAVSHPSVSAHPRLFSIMITPARTEFIERPQSPFAAPGECG